MIDFSTFDNTKDYIYSLYVNLHDKLREDFDEKNFFWVLGSDVIWQLITRYDGTLYSYKTIDDKRKFVLYGIRVEEDRVNPRTIRIYEDITEFLERGN